MPIRVKCTCGKIFRVKDEYAGRQVQCQVCQAEITVPESPELSEEAQAAPMPAPMPEPGPTAPQTATVECPACAESIPAGSAVCPLCGESLSGQLDAGQASRILDDSLASLDAHLGDRQSTEEDTRLKGGLLTTKTIVLMVITGLCVAMIASGASMRRDGEPLIAIGIILGIIFGISVLVSLTNDYRSIHIQDCRDPAKALKNYLTAIRTKRTSKAFACLVPEARQSGRARSVKFTKIKSALGDFTILDAASFAKYWTSVFKGPSGQTRSVQIKKVYKIKEGDQGLALVEAELAFSSYPSWLIALILLNLIICVIAIMACTKRESLTIRKLMVQRDNRWFIVEGELQGRLDQAEII